MPGKKGSPKAPRKRSEQSPRKASKAKRSVRVSGGSRYDGPSINRGSKLLDWVAANPVPLGLTGQLANNTLAIANLQKSLQQLMTNLTSATAASGPVPPAVAHLYT
eukprot:jgi/Chrzof1/12338/Cz06g31020.t1